MYLCSPDLSRSQNKVLDCLEFIPEHEDPVTTANYDSIRRYLIKVQVSERETCAVTCNVETLIQHIHSITQSPEKTLLTLFVAWMVQYSPSVSVFRHVRLLFTLWAGW